MGDQHLISGKERECLLKTAGTDVDSAYTSIDIEHQADAADAGGNSHSGLMAGAVALLPAAPYGSSCTVPEFRSGVGDVRSMSWMKNRIVAAILIGLPLFSLVAYLLQPDGADATGMESSGVMAEAVPNNSGEPARQDGNVQLTMAVAAYLTAFSSIIGFLRQHSGPYWFTGRPPYELSGQHEPGQVYDAPEYQTPLPKPGTTTTLLSLLQLGAGSQAVLRPSPAMPESAPSAVMLPAAAGSAAAAERPPLLAANPAVPQNAGWFARPWMPPADEYSGNDISAEQLESDLRVIDSMVLPDLDYLLDAGMAEVQHGRHKRHASNDSSLKMAVEELLVAGLPEHVRSEFEHLRNNIKGKFSSLIIKSREKPQGRQFLAISSVTLLHYLRQIVKKGEAGKGAYYFCHIKMKELTGLAKKYRINLAKVIQPEINRMEKEGVARLANETSLLAGNAGNVYDAYIEQHFPKLKSRGIRASDIVAYAFLPDYQRNIHFISVASLLREIPADLQIFALSFYDFQGLSTGFKNEELDRLLDSATSAQFQDFRLRRIEKTVDEVMEKDIPAHLLKEWTNVYQVAVKEAFNPLSDMQALPKAIFMLKISYVEMASYLDHIVKKGEESKAAYYYCHIKMMELQDVAKKNDLDFLGLMKQQLLFDSKIIRRENDEHAADEPDDLYDTYIHEYFPLLRERGVRGTDRIAYSFQASIERNIHFVSVADLLDRGQTDLVRSTLAFYHFLGYENGFPDAELDRLLASVTGPQFQKFKAQYRLLEMEQMRSFLEQHLGGMTSTPVGFQRASLLPEMLAHAGPLTPLMRSRWEALLTREEPKLTQKGNVLMLGAETSIADLIEKNPDFEGMVSSAILNTDFLYRYRDKDSAVRYDTASLPQILNKDTGLTELPIAQRADVDVLWPDFFSARQKDFLAAEMAKLNRTAAALEQALPRIIAQTNFWLAMPPPYLLFNQIVEDICEREGSKRLQLTDQFVFQYENRPVLPGNSFSLPIKDMKRATYSVLDILLGNKRLMERDEWFLSAKFIYPPAHLNESPEMILKLVKALNDFNVQDKLIERYRNYQTDTDLIKAFGDLRRIVEPQNMDPGWVALEFENNPNILLYVFRPKLDRSRYRDEKGEIRARDTVLKITDRKVEILFRLSGNRYRYDSFLELIVAIGKNEKLKNDVELHVDMEIGFAIEKMQWNSASYKYEPDDVLLKRIIDWGILNIDKRINSAAETLAHEILDGFSLGGYVAFIPAMGLSWPLGLLLGVTYGVMPQMIQSWIATREDEIARLRYEAFKNLMIEIAGTGVGVAVEKASSKLISLSAEGYQALRGGSHVKGDAVVKGAPGTVSLKNAGNKSSAIKGVDHDAGIACARLVPQAICEAAANDDGVILLTRSKADPAAINDMRLGPKSVSPGQGGGMKSTGSLEDKFENVIAKLNSVILEGAKYPVAADFNAWLPTEAYLAQLGFTEITYRVAGLWRQDEEAHHHIVTLATMDDMNYAIDFGQRPSSRDTLDPQNVRVTEARHWDQAYLSSNSSAQVIYKDFNRRRAALNFFHTMFARE